MTYQPRNERVVMAQCHISCHFMVLVPRPPVFQKQIYFRSLVSDTKDSCTIYFLSTSTTGGVC